MTFYQNPILRGMYPDPSIVRVGDTFFMVNSTFEYYPGIALSKSKDLLNWQKLPSIVTSPEQADLSQAKSNEGIFAVCIRYYKNTFYVITTNFSEFKTIIIRGYLTEDGQKIIWESKRTTVDINGIDPDLFFEDNRFYVQFTGYIDSNGTKAIQQVEIDIDTGEILDGPKVLTFGTGGRDVEGPHIIKNNSWYYLLMAEGGTGVGHFVTIMRSKNLWGPYNDEQGINPLFTNRDRANEPLQNIGHADLFQDAMNNWWIVCLGTRPAKNNFTEITNLGRETLLYPVLWEKEWPVIYNGIPSVTVDLSNFPKHQLTLPKHQLITNFEDNFLESKLHPEWVCLRNKLSDKELILKNGSLTLVSNQYTLNDLHTPCFLGIRQTEHNENFIVHLNEDSNLYNGKFGIVSLINADHYGGILIEKNNDGFNIIRYQKVADIELNESLGTLKKLPEKLILKNNDNTKTFIVENTKTKEILSYTTSAIHFSNEAIAALNTGDFQGMYSLDGAKMVVSKVERHIPNK